MTLDLDFAEVDFAETFGDLYEYRYIIYSTHKHQKEKPRLRLVLPLSRNATAEEYEAVGRKVAETIGIDMFDDTTYQPHRLMYFPSTSTKAEYVFKSRESGTDVDVEKILSEYDDWKDVSTYPVSNRTEKHRKKILGKQVDPTTKEGLIGAFCRTYDVHEVIATFLPEIYIDMTENGERYTFAEGSTFGGAIVYENGNFLYSNHATDPAGQTLCNAFDLLRIHKFGHEDVEIKKDVPVSKLPSFQLASELIAKDEKVKLLLHAERQAEAMSEFADYVEEEETEKASTDWVLELKTDKSGKVMNLIENAAIILQKDPRLAEKIKYNEFTKRIDVLGKLPWEKRKKQQGKSEKQVKCWTDTDDAGLRYYIEKVYGLRHKGNIEDAFTFVTYKNRYHPVQEYLDGLTWDGKERIADIFPEYLGAESTSYAKEVSKIHFTACVKRIFENGCKYDNVIILVGKQGVGKSEFIKRIGGDWYSDTLDNVQGKDAYEQLQGVWIMELGELAALNKKESETIKHFIGKREDNFRSAYAKRTETHKRQCVFWGSTNTYEFLKDMTGNRRFFPIDVGVKEIQKSIFNDLDKEVNQIWAEAVTYYKQGKEIYLKDDDLKQLAELEQDKHLSVSNLTGEVLMHLEKKLPTNWADYDMTQRRMFYMGGEFGTPKEGDVERTKVCVMEVWCEMLGEAKNMLTTGKSKEIKEIILKSGDWEMDNHPKRFGKLYGNQRGFAKKENLIL